MIVFPVERRRFATLAVAALAAALATSAFAQATTWILDDDGQIFSPAARQVADAKLDALQERTGRRVVVLTLDKPPSEIADAVAGNPARRNAAFLRLAEQRAAVAKADVLVLINRSPGNLQIVERRVLLTTGLPAADRTSIADAMLADFRGKHFDEGLTAGVDRIVSALDRASPATRRAAADEPSSDVDPPTTAPATR